MRLPAGLILAGSLCLFGLNGYCATRTVTDDVGNQVVLPAKTERIADAWYAHHSLLMTLGAGGEIVATVNHPQTQPWMFAVQPSLHQALSTTGTAFNVESLLARGVDVVFVTAGDRNAVSLRQAGLPVVEMRFVDFDSMKRSLRTTAQVLGTASASRRAEEYIGYLDAQLQGIDAKTAGLTPQQRPRVLHIQSLNPLKVDGGDTLIDQWIRRAGGRNAAQGLKGNMQPVSIEQVLAWKPDAIIVAANAGELSRSAWAGQLAQLDAVKAGRVWRNPAGVFPWDRYGTETALQIQWAAQKLHPQLFPQLNLRLATQDFYRRFFDYTLSDEQADRILAGRF
ncbi:ABC transporter substrate-binding protein [Affinibrenneria salicis]|uniref:ABC transporter substrate-binding protein n=1 Tax=Affinibrenneria salicis TaxID=2590031 RepID=A0A5J5FTV5_9GAMM|nr:ABC transporter substrate-binding protein [Affinibrenneria salicis]KAA8996634.1 ABC transporter substrate-binding protein [Affinibrenneria salicis]